MTASRDPDRLIRAFLDEGDVYLQDQVYDEVRAAIEHRRQRVYFGPWRTPIMNRIVTFGLGAAAVVVIGLLLGAQLLGEPTGLGGPSDPTATPESTAAPTPTATPRPTRTPEAGLPVGPFGIELDGQFSEEDSGMAVTVTIPSSGWFFERGWNLLGKGPGEVDSPYIAFWAFPSQEFYVPADACRMTSTRPDTPVTTVDELAAALAARTSPDVSEPVDVTVGGYEGKFITLHVPEDLEADECEEGDFVYYITSPDDFWRNSQEPGQIEELWILDVDGTIVILNALYRPDTPAELVEDTRGIVESTIFEVP